MKAKALLHLLAATALVVLVFPGAAAARARPANRHSTTAPEVSAEFTVQGANGYEISTSVTNRRELKLVAVKWADVIQTASYSLRLRPKRGADEIVASLGRFGRIDVRFVPKKARDEAPPKDCHGSDTVVEQGHFVGTIAFRGEDRFTEVQAHRAAGSITRVPSFECPPVSPTPNPKKIRRELEALEKAEAEEDNSEESLAVRLHATAREGRVALTATKVVEKGKHGKASSTNALLAVATRRRGRIEESNAAVELFGKGSTLLVPNRRDPKSEGILKPPAPFSGSATFRRHPDKRPTWTGDLKVALPSFGEVRLTGPGTHASMCEGTACLLRDLLSEGKAFEDLDRR